MQENNNTTPEPVAEPKEAIDLQSILKANEIILNKLNELESKVKAPEIKVKKEEPNDYSDNVIAKEKAKQEAIEYNKKILETAEKISEINDLATKAIGKAWSKDALLRDNPKATYEDIYLTQRKQLVRSFIDKGHIKALTKLDIDEIDGEHLDRLVEMAKVEIKKRQAGKVEIDKITGKKLNVSADPRRITDPDHVFLNKAEVVDAFADYWNDRIMKISQKHASGGN